MGSLESRPACRTLFDLAARLVAPLDSIPDQPFPASGQRWGTQSASDFLVREAAKHLADDGWRSNDAAPNISGRVGRRGRRGGLGHLGSTHRTGVAKDIFRCTAGVSPGGLVRAGVNDFLTAYKLAVFLAIVGLGAWYTAAVLLVGRGAALTSTIAMGTVPLFLRLVDSPAGYLYDFAFAATALAGAAAYLRCRANTLRGSRCSC